MTLRGSPAMKPWKFSSVVSRIRCGAELDVSEVRRASLGGSLPPSLPAQNTPFRLLAKR